MTKRNNRATQRKRIECQTLYATTHYTVESIAKLVDLPLRQVQYWYQYDNWEMYRTLAQSDNPNVFHTIVNVEITKLISLLNMFTYSLEAFPRLVKSAKTLQDVLDLQNAAIATSNQITNCRRHLLSLQVIEHDVNRYDDLNDKSSSRTVQAFIHLDRRIRNKLVNALKYSERTLNGVEICTPSRINLGTLHKEPKQSIGEQLKKEKAERKYYRGF